MMVAVMISKRIAILFTVTISKRIIWFTVTISKRIAIIIYCDLRGPIKGTARTVTSCNVGSVLYEQY